MTIEGSRRPFGQPTERLHEVVTDNIAIPVVQVVEDVAPFGQLDIQYLSSLMGYVL